MPLADPVSIAFIIRFWLERREIEGEVPIWRGVVEHIPSGEQHYFDTLAELPTVLTPYLDAKSQEL